MNKYIIHIFLLLFLSLSSTYCFAQDLEKIKEIKTIKDKKAFEYGGSLSLGASYYNSSGPQRMNPYNWVISGSPFIKLYGINIPFTFTYNETGRSLTHPFHYNFSGASPHYKWATTHIGYRSMNFSEYTLSGKVFNGVGIELNPKKIRFGAFYGVFNPAVEMDSNTADFGVVLPAYQRIGYGAKLGFGSQTNYFDLIYFRGKDVVNSLSKPPSFQTIKPSDNTTFSPRFKITLFKRWFLESDIAISLFTRNVLNDTLTETDVLRDVYQFIRVNTTTYGSYAGHAATGITFDNWGLAFRAKRVSSDYQSMGINLMQDDIQEFTLNPSLQLFRGKIGLSGSYGMYTDNLSKKRTNTTARKIYNTSVNLNLHQRINASFGYSNFGTTRTNGIVQMNDSITFSIINESYNGNLGLIFGPIKKPIVVSVFALYQNTADRNVFTEKYNNSQVFNIGLGSQYKFAASKLQLSGNGSYAQFAVGGKNFSTIGSQLSLRKPLIKNKLNASLSTSYTKRYEEQTYQGDVISMSLGGQIKLGKRHNLTLQSRIMQNNTGIVSNSSFNEQRVNIHYGFTF